MNKIRKFSLMDIFKKNNESKNIETYTFKENPKNSDILELKKGPVTLETYNFNKEKQEQMDIVSLRLNSGTPSDTEAIEFLINAIGTEIKKGNENVSKFLMAILEVKKKNPQLHFKISHDNKSPIFDPNTKEVIISDFHNGIVFHELGHMLHQLNTKKILPDEIGDKYNTSAQNFFSDEKGYWKLMDYLSEECEKAYEFSKDKYNPILLANKNKSVDQYLKELTAKYRLNPTSDISPEKLAKYELRGEEQMVMYEEIYYRDQGLTAIHDMIDSLFGGTFHGDNGAQYDSKGEMFNVGGHGVDYYKNPIVRYSEMIANYTELLISGNTEKLKLAKEILGEELFNQIELTYKEMTTIE